MRKFYGFLSTSYHFYSELHAQLSHIRKEIIENEGYLNGDIKKSLYDKSESLQKRILNSTSYLAELKNKETRLLQEVKNNPHRSQLEEESIELETKIQHYFSQAYMKIINAKHISSAHRDEMKAYFNSKGQVPYSFETMAQLLNDIEDQKKAYDHVCCNRILECVCHCMTFIVLSLIVGAFSGGRTQLNGPGPGFTDYEAPLKEISAIYSDVLKAVTDCRQLESINQELQHLRVVGSVRTEIAFTS